MFILQIGVQVQIKILTLVTTVNPVTCISGTKKLCIAKTQLDLQLMVNMDMDKPLIKFCPPKKG